MKNEKRKARTISLLKAIKRRRKLAGSFVGNGNTYNPKYFYPRHLARSVAKHNMARAGIEHINKLFAYNWRNYVRVR